MTKPETSHGLWFLSNHVTVGTSKHDNADGISVLKLRLPFDEAPPLHVHHGEDEIFHILRGDVRFRVGDTTLNASAGDTLVGPRGVPHGFRVLSEEGAEILTITRGGFEDMVCRMASSAERNELPPVPVITPDMQATFSAVCSEHQIDLLGPPIER
jgi:mannose-6-phosphate isomerase-like protein (cupin superfamily)